MFLLFLLSALDLINGDFFGDLIEKHSDRLKGYVFTKVNNEQDSEDIVQDIFFKVYRYIDKFAGLSDDDVKRLLITYAKSSVADFYRKNKKLVKTIDGYYDGSGNELEVADSSLSPENIDVSNLKTSKEDTSLHGYGILNMKAVAEKYNGEVVFECLDKVFKTIIAVDNN